MEQEIDKQEKIHSKGFDMGVAPIEFNSMKLGNKKLEDFVVDLGAIKHLRKTFANKNETLRALADKDLKRLREISELFYRTNGIYFRVCNYFAQMYRYDWYIVPEVYDKNAKTEKIISDFSDILNYLDNSQIKKTCGRIAKEIIIKGAYYGCLMESDEGIVIQDLPIEYCRSRFHVGNNPLIELNMQFFTNKFPNEAYRERVLKAMPEDIRKGYRMYKKRLLMDENNHLTSWYVLEPGSAIKFSFDNQDMPLFASAIPAIFDLDAAQDLDRRKQMQKLLKIIVQKLPLDKNNDLIFDVDEARDIHANAVQMLQNAIGVDVLTTFADIDSVDISDKTTTTSVDDLQKIERTLYNAFGIPQNLFNSTGNTALANSILNDESLCRGLLLQFNSFFDKICQQLKKSNYRKYRFRFYMLETTQYNYKEMAKVYKEQVQIGYSKMLPQIALGHSQSFILNSCHFENEVLKLHEIMIPPMMSSTMSSTQMSSNQNDQKNLGKDSKSNSSNSQNSMETKESGRPEKPDAEKSDKTIANLESIG